MTERDTARIALARMQARFHAVLDTAADATVVIGETGVVEHLNPAAERLLGLERGGGAGQTVSLLLPALAPYFERHAVGGIAPLPGRELTCPREDGIPIRWNFAITEWRHGDKRVLTGILRHIRDHADVALGDAGADPTGSPTLLRALFDGMPEALFFKDRDGRYLIANRATAIALGGSETVVGKTDYDLIAVDQANRFRAADLEVMASGTSKVIEETVDGSRWFLTAKMPVRTDKGDIIGVLGLARDITDYRAMMEQLKQAKDQAEAASRAKTSFLAAASHDLRQPIQALVLFTAALQGKLKGFPAANIVGRMKQSLDALGMLLEGLLDISKLDAGVVTLNLQPFPVAAISGRLAQEYAISAKRKGLRLRAVGGGGDWTVTDPTHLERVLRNLIENAIRYTERGGILIGCRRRGQRILLQVIDTGIGIPEDQIDLIFQEFHQLGNPERDRAKGLGLGLSIVRRLLNLLGHEMRVSSVPGRGSCFTIDLPEVEGGDHPLGLPDARPSEDPDGRLILVIDDEAIVRQGLEILLGDWGHRVVAAADVPEAVNLARTVGVPDVILADYRLQGGRTGNEAVEAVRQACARPVPAIILTGDTAPERIAEVQRSGHLIAHKPVSGEQLQRLIAAAMKDGRNRHPMP